MGSPTNLTRVLEDIHANCQHEHITVGDIIESFEHRGFGPLMLAASLLTVSPIGVVPGVPAVTGILVILFAGQLLLGRRTPWVPRRLREFSIEKSRFESARIKIEPYTKKFDRLLKSRLHFFTSPLAIRLVAVLCILLAILLGPLEFVPFAALLPALAILFFALGICVHDGLMVLLGLVVTAITGFLARQLLPMAMVALPG